MSTPHGSAGPSAQRGGIAGAQCLLTSHVAFLPARRLGCLLACVIACLLTATAPASVLAQATGAVGARVQVVRETGRRADRLMDVLTAGGVTEDSVRAHLKDASATGCHLSDDERGLLGKYTQNRVWYYLTHEALLAGVVERVRSKHHGTPLKMCLPTADYSSANLFTKTMRVNLAILRRRYPTAGVTIEAHWDERREFAFDSARAGAWRVHGQIPGGVVKRQVICAPRIGPDPELHRAVLLTVKDPDHGPDRGSECVLERRPPDRKQ